MTGAIRGSGTYTTYQGRPWRVSGRSDLPELKLYDAGGASTVLTTAPAEQVGLVEKVVTTATWRGGQIVVGTQTAPMTVGFYTDDAALAEREDLYGDQHSGWRGTALVSDLEDTSERVTVLREAGSAS